MQKPWVIFDYDDTLGGVQINGSVEPNYKAYDDVLFKFGIKMTSHGFDAREALVIQNEIDSKLAKDLGFANKERFAQSFVQTYRTMSSQYDLSTFAFEERELFDLGMSVFEYPYVPLEGALETVSVLRRYYNIAIATKGEYDEQMRKLNVSGTLSLVDEVAVMGHKDAAEWETFIRKTLKIGRIRNIHSWAVGNSVKSDVNPPLRLGLNAIHIGSMVGTWAFEKGEYDTPSRHRQLHVVERICDVLGIIPFPQPRTT